MAFLYNARRFARLGGYCMISMNSRASRLGLVAGCSLLALSALPASAQTPTATDVNEIVVVGSQIKGSSVAGTLPVTRIDAAAIETIGAISGDDLFRALPSNGALLTSNLNYTAGINAVRGDVASINLRSLGTGNTLTLINGRRMVQHPGSQSGEESIPITTPNMNSLPVLGIERVEVLRDGASALYGADAVAGVVNSVLQGDYDGLKVSATYRKPRDTSSYEAVLSGQAGRSFNEGATHLTVFGSYARQTAIHTRDRDFSRSEDKRDLVAGTAFANDLDFRGTTDNTPWGQFALGRAVRQNGTLVTSTTGLFHIQPIVNGGCLAQLRPRPDALGQARKPFHYGQAPSLGRPRALHRGVGLRRELRDPPRRRYASGDHAVDDSRQQLLESVRPGAVQQRRTEPQSPRRD